MRHYVLSVESDGSFKHIEELKEEEFVASRPRYRELLEKEAKLAKLENSPQPAPNYVYLGGKHGVFTFSCSEIKDPIDCGVYMLKPCLHKYFKDHNYSKSTRKIEKQMAIIAMCHRIEEALIDYLDELEEFNK